MKNRTFMCFPSFKDKALTFSYDDGIIFDKRLIDIFNTYGLKSTFNLNSACYGRSKRLTKEECVTLFSNSEMEIAAHGYKHLSLANVDVSVATDDVITDRKELEITFGRIVKGMAYAKARMIVK